MARVRYIEALSRALRDELAADPQVMVLGEDVRHSLRRVTYNLAAEFGEHRVIDTPLAEQAATGFATGAALLGWRPVLEFQVPTLLYVAFDQVVNQAQKLSIMTGGQARVPVTYLFLAPGHGWDWPASIPITPMPSSPRQGSRQSFRPRRLTPTRCSGRRSRTMTRSRSSPRPPSLGNREDLPGEISRSRSARDASRSGRDVTLVAVGHLVPVALAAAAELANRRTSP